MKIGIFDSGIGGLSVLHQAIKLMPCHSYLYYADEKHVPYGEKTQAQIVGYVDDIIAFMLDKGCQAIVIACNTATSAAVKIMRQKYQVPIIGMEPAVKKAFDLYGNQRVLVVATPITVRGQKMHELVERVDKKELVDLVALPQLVRFAENQEFSSQQVIDYLQDQFKDLPLESYSSIVLGCTHFNYFKDSFRDVLPPHVRFVDGNLGTINHLKRYLHTTSPFEVEYYYSHQQVKGQELEKIERYLQRLDKMLEIE